MAWLVRKPGSVVDGHLSRMHVAVHLKPPVGTIGQIIVPVGVAADRVYRPPMLPWDVVSSYLAFPPLRKRESLPRYISVALSLKSPSPDVIRRPVLCCPDFPHGAFAPRDRKAILFSEKHYSTFFLFCRVFSSVFLNFPRKFFLSL